MKMQSPIKAALAELQTITQLITVAPVSKWVIRVPAWSAFVSISSNVIRPHANLDGVSLFDFRDINQAVAEVRASGIEQAEPLLLARYLTDRKDELTEQIKTLSRVIEI